MATQHMDVSESPVMRMANDLHLMLQAAGNETQASSASAASMIAR